MPKSVTMRIVQSGAYDNIMKRHDQEHERKKKEFREYMVRELKKRQ
jgi:hypothetical protein